MAQFYPVTRDDLRARLVDLNPADPDALGRAVLGGGDGWYGERTLIWGGGLTLTWFIDRKNDLCGVGAVQASLPVDAEAVAALKQTFREDIYRKRAAWMKEQAA